MSQDINTPFHAIIKKRELLSLAGSTKKTFHIELDLSNSNINYEPGDTIGIYPQFPDFFVEDLLQVLQACPKTVIDYKKKQISIPLREILKSYIDLRKVTKKFLRALLERLPQGEEKDKLTELLLPENKAALSVFLESSDICDCLKKFHGASWDLDEFCAVLQPLLPRYYSIASSQKHVESELHLTVALVEYEGDFGNKKGVCSAFLCEETFLNEATIPIFHKPNPNFFLPHDSSTHIIMIGPGTGIAPFRGFLQERMQEKSHGKNLLFFGERNAQYDFFYEEFWSDLQQQDRLDLHTAFSRDQQEKIYVQDRILEQEELIWDLLQKGAYLYVCGDANKMAKDVEQALMQIIEKHMKCDTKAARTYLQHLRKEKRYQRDVY
jgi:sulfite reductase (NADPH) flavoprotein alpha-component